MGYNGYLKPYLPAIKKALDAGVTISEIVRQFYDKGGVYPSREMIKYALKREGMIFPEPPSPTDRYSFLLPKDVADKQRSWERYQQVLRARRAGAKLQEIGNAMGLSRERVRQMEARAERAVRNGKKAPIEHYLDMGEIGLVFNQILDANRRMIARRGPNPMLKTWNKPEIKVWAEWS